MAVDPENLRDFARCYTAARCRQNPASVAAFFHGKRIAAR